MFYFCRNRARMHKWRSLNGSDLLDLFLAFPAVESTYDGPHMPENGQLTVEFLDQLIGEPSLPQSMLVSFILIVHKLLWASCS